MIQKVIKKAILYLKHCNTIHTSEKRLDIRKLKLLLNTLGFNPTSNGTLYIIEELEFFYNNGIGEIKYLNEAYIISAKIHKTDIKNIQLVKPHLIRIYFNKLINKESFYNIRLSNDTKDSNKMFTKLINIVIFMVHLLFNGCKD